MGELKVNNIRKSFPGVQALDAVELTVLPGEIHALCGENGAGKSTLMNILAGNLQPDSGSVEINGDLVHLRKPQDAFAQGIAVVYQHLSLSDNLSVAENIYANQHPRNKWGIIQFNALYQKTITLLRDLSLDDINPGTLVSKLSPAQKQMVEIAKALARNPPFFILDEPTASLTEKETTTLFAILNKLKNQGTAIIYISHRLEEIFLIADRVSILKDGKYQGTFLKKELTREILIKRMVGRDIESVKNTTYSTQEVLLEVKGLSGKRFRNISFSLMRGEILGLGGLVGAGRTEIARAIFGADGIESGLVILRNEKLWQANPSHSVSKGIAYVPEDRKKLALFPEMSIQDNIISGNLSHAVEGKWYSRSRAKRLALDAVKKFRIAAPGVMQKVRNLSGGNQQKVVLAKWLLTQPDVLIVDEPTHGIDVGAKFEIYTLLQSLAKQGKGILIISSDMPELLGICDRILVINKGNFAGEVSGVEATEENIMALASN